MRNLLQENRFHIQLLLHLTILNEPDKSGEGSEVQGKYVVKWNNLQSNIGAKLSLTNLILPNLT